MSGRRGGVPDGDRTDGCMGDGGDAFRINPPVGQAAAVTVEIVDDRGLIVNLRDLGRCRAIMARMRVAKMLYRNKRETICAQTPVETDADGASAIKETDAGLVGCIRRQRRPAAVTTRIPPGHPGRTPNGVRRPAPAPARMLKPAPVMERRPAPRIIRKPIPAAVGINPVSMIAIRLPAGVVNHHAGPPAPAIAVHVHPGAIRRKRVIKIIHRDFRRWLRRLLLRRRRGFRLLGWCRVAGGSGLSRGLIRRRGHLLLQLLVALHHGGDDFVRQANVLQINDFVRIEIERAAGIRDVSHDDAFIHAGLRKPDDLCQRAGRINVRWQCA